MSDSIKSHSALERKDRQQVLFMPDIAYCNEDGDVVASLQAWVYRYKNRRRLKHMFALMCGVDMRALDEETRAIFYTRMQLFMTDSTSGYQLHVRDEQGNRHILPPTLANGRTHALISLPGHICTHNRKINFLLDKGHEAITNTTNCYDIACFFAPPHGISIISDIDDTIKQSFVGNKSKLLRTTFLEEYRPVPQMCEWYQNLAKNTKVAFHYVSSSPLQLYPALCDFMAAKHYPEGSIHLRETTRLREVIARPPRAKQHKKAVIERLLAKFKQRKFILIGDSGGNDASIYAKIARDYPQQIAAICIRHVLPSARAQPYEKIFHNIAPSRWFVSDEVGALRQFIEQLDIWHDARKS